MPTWFTELISPLSLAGYVAWGVVWITVRSTVEQRHPALLPQASVALIVFLLSFIAGANVPPSTSRTSLTALYLAMLGSALFVIYLWPFGTANILLVLFAVMLAMRLPPWAVVLTLLGSNTLVVVFMLTQTNGTLRDALLSVLAYASFQAFATLVIRSMQSAERMAEDLRATNAELMTTRLLLAESARDQERLRMSRELHDVAGHGLTALKLNLGVLARDQRQPDPERIAVCAGLADELLQNLRRVVQQLRAEPGLDLRAALLRIALPFPRPKLSLDIFEPLPALQFAQVEAVMRAVQEALTNAARHGNAQHLRVSLRADGDRLNLHIADDGRVSGPVRAGGGLSGMRERFEELGGSLSVSAADAGGLNLHASFPLIATGANG